MAEPSAARAVRALRRHAPELADLPLRELGHGLDNTAFVVGELVLRVAEGPDVQREAGLLAFLAPRLPLAVPVPVFADGDAGVLGHRLLPGRPLLARTPAPGTAAVLGRFLRDLHAVDPGAVRAFVDEEDADPAEWLGGLDGPAELLRVVRSSVPRSSPRRVVAHADLGAEHLLAEGTRVTGVIDWSDCAVTDPALDFARLHRDFGPAFLAEALQAYGGLPDAGPRIQFFARCAALEDLEYGLRTGRAEYAEAARRSIAWLFST
ncbi:phosphotransferase family protein [Geodermatophilus obscurus]|uniref:phosphotransferase family protein n=1 Tax=Geodermatophilus obscurus TaxID=1861 RepID=UPI0015882553|nr:phosphotransferase [Geodermatophilus obscurus]